jgi:peptidoglycan/xylan/chitin deacetylase (PgdA/CDA1 family)
VPRRPAVPLLVVLALALAGCGSGSTAAHQPAASSGSHAAAAHPKAGRTTRQFRPARGAYRGPVPILMYHVVDAAPPGAPYPELFVPWRLFAQQMFALHQAGYRGVTLGQVWAAWHGGPGVPRKAVVVSFDDGYQSQATHAAKTLQALGWPGVLNLKVGNLHVEGGLNRTEVRRMIAAGWELDAHTITHPDLTTVGAAQLHREVAGSRSILRSTFRVPVQFFCYPAGRYDATVEAAVKAAGYQGATTEQPGLASKSGDPFALDRIRVNASESPAAVLASIRSGGDGSGSTSLAAG